MAAGTRSIDVMTPKRRLMTLAIGAAYLLVTGAALEAVGLFVANPMTSVFIGALLVGFISSRAGLASEELTAAARKRALYPAAATLGLVVLVVAVAIAWGSNLVRVGPSATALFGAAEGFALGYVGEVWLHGMPLLFADRAQVSLRYAYPYAVVAGMTPYLLDGGFDSTTLVLSAASGAFFTALWVRGGDGWGPIAAHFVWAWCADSLLAGDLFDLGTTAGRLMHGPGSEGLIAWLAAAGFALLTLLVLLRKLPVGPTMRREPGNS